MNSTYEPILNKKQTRILTFLVCVILLAVTILPSYAVDFGNIGDMITEEAEGIFEYAVDGLENVKGYVTDAILVGALETLIMGIDFAGELFVKLLTTSFSPSLNPLLNIEKGLSFSTPIADDAYYEGATIDNSFTIMAIWEFAFMFGIITCTLLMFFYLFMCLVGQQEQIRDTPFMLLVKYAVSLALIYFSKYFITGFIDFFYDMWTTLVFTKDISTPETYTAFLPIWWENGDFRNGDLVAFGVKIVTEKAGTAGVVGSILAMPFTGGASGSVAIGIILVIIIFALYFGWKIIKEFMKLFLEVVERYFVVFILLAFFPAVASTFVSNNSKKIFYAYIKMLYSQGFLLLVNTIFMVIFFKILLVGGWSAGLINYIGALAFLRICQRIDAYMAQLGINIVQTGGGLMSACGSVFGGALAGMSALRGADRTRKNVGTALMNKGISTGSYKDYNTGLNLKKTGSDMVIGLGSNSSASQQLQNVSNFEQMVLANGGFKQGQVMQFSPNRSLNDNLRDHHLPSTYGDKLQKELGNAKITGMTVEKDGGGIMSVNYTDADGKEGKAVIYNGEVIANKNEVNEQSVAQSYNNDIHNQNTALSEKISKAGMDNAKKSENSSATNFIADHSVSDGQVEKVNISGRDAFYVQGMGIEMSSQEGNIHSYGTVYYPTTENPELLNNVGKDKNWGLSDDKQYIFEVRGKEYTNNSFENEVTHQKDSNKYESQPRSGKNKPRHNGRK